jgi:hypothetical protein
MLALLASPLLIAISGCEVDSTDQASISVSPNYATIKEGQSITFTASGWTDYHWNLSDTSIGVLSSSVGSSVIYTAVKDSATTQTLQVSSVTGTAGTNSSGLVSFVTIQHELTNPPVEE